MLFVTTSGLGADRATLDGVPQKRIQGKRPFELSRGMAVHAPRLVRGVCVEDEDCIDDNACTTDACVDNACVHTDMPGCVPCQIETICPPVDIVFLIDTSGSMLDEAVTLCAAMDETVAQLGTEGIDVSAAFFGITQTPPPFPCLLGDVVTSFGGDTPGNDTCSFPGTLSSHESWGPATAIVAERYPWAQGALRIVIPVSDEGPCSGSEPDGCNLVGDDADSIDNAASIAGANGVIVSPITGSGADSCTIELAEVLASETGGIAVHHGNTPSSLLDGVLNIVRQACVEDDSCDDADPCTEQDRCVDGICAGAPIPGCRTCDDDIDCDDNDDCTIDTCIDDFCAYQHIPGCGPCVNEEDCDDGNACTIDECVDDQCTHVDAFDLSTECCDPDTGTIISTDDGDVCTVDVCDPSTGVVGHEAAPPDTPCDDGNPCTIDDVCGDIAQCSGVDINTIACTDDVDCFGYPCDTDAGHCLCNEIPDLCLVVETDPTGGSCYEVGQEIIFHVELGISTQEVAGGQFLIRYDPSILTFVDIVPGGTVDDTSPFVLVLSEIVDEQAGRVFYAVGAPLGEEGSFGPATMASLTFEVTTPCAETDLCFVDENPHHTTLVSATGQNVPYTLCCPDPIMIGEMAPVLTCPSSVVTLSDPNTRGATVTWGAITAELGCAGASVPACSATHTAGVDIEDLIDGGGWFGAGVGSFACSVVDDCGQVATCDWTVEVLEENLIEIEVQMAPPMADRSLERCMTFEVFASALEPIEYITQTVALGPPFNPVGMNRRVQFTVPAGSYQCVMVRDPAHSLRSTAPLTIQGDRFFGSVAGDPMLGGNWLRTGDLNDSGTIDTVDFGIYMVQYLTNQEVHTPCDGPFPHADINGDGLVDAIDGSFISLYYLSTDAPSCGEGVVAGTATAAVNRVSVKAFSELGYGDGSVADLNHDGMIDDVDVSLFQQGWRPGHSMGLSGPIR